MVLQANGPKKQAGVAILIFKITHFKPKLIRRDKEYYIFIKGEIHQEDNTILNICVLTHKGTQVHKRNIIVA